METELLSVDDITRILRISKFTAQRWCCERRLPAAKIGKWYQGKLLDHNIAEQ